MNKRIFLKISAFVFCVVLVLSLLCSCSKKQYNDTLDCAYITSTLQSKMLTDEAYSAYSAEDIAFMLDDSDKFDSYSVIYSSSSDDIGEIGVFHAISEEESLDLLDDVAEYLSELKEEKGSFVRNYLPNEQKKLDGANVKRFGNYVVFTVLDSAKSDAVFKEIERLLK